MKKSYLSRVCKLSLLAVALHIQNVQSITLVYNMKIRRAFNTSALTGLLPKTELFATGLPVIYVRNRHFVIPSLQENTHEKIVVAGAIFNFRVVTPSYWWGELSTGLEHQSIKTTGTMGTFAVNTKVADVGLDDIIISAGKNFVLKDDNQVALYGIAGFPTKTKVTLEERNATLTGSRFFGLGAGAELSHAFMHRADRSFVGIFQTRFVHFFNRKWYPILPQDARIQPGNITDIFFIAQYNHRAQVFEAGYNPTIFTDQAALLRTGVVRGPQAVRNSFYLNYMHMFRESFVCKLPGAVGIGFNFASSDVYDTKILSGWLNLTFLF